MLSFQCMNAPIKSYFTVICVSVYSTRLGLNKIGEIAILFSANVTLSTLFVSSSQNGEFCLISDILTCSLYVTLDPELQKIQFTMRILSMSKGVV